MARDLSTLSKALASTVGDAPERVDHVVYPDGRTVDRIVWSDGETVVFEKAPGVTVRKIAKEDFSL